MRILEVTIVVANTADTAHHRPETHKTSSSLTSRQSLSKTVLKITMPLRTAKPSRPITKCKSFFTKYDILSRSFHQTLAQWAGGQTHCFHKTLPSTIKYTLQERCLNMKRPQNHHTPVISQIHRPSTLHKTTTDKTATQHARNRRQNPPLLVQRLQLQAVK
jgi:hypothetical protein